MRERLNVYYCGQRALAEKLPRKAAELKERMSDEGAPSPIYDEIAAAIERHIAQVM